LSSEFIINYIIIYIYIYIYEKKKYTYKIIIILKNQMLKKRGSEQIDIIFEAGEDLFNQ
jgi:hypothetical protein